MLDQQADEEIDIGVSGFTLPGENESGDLEIVKRFPGGILLGVVDGLGHGLEAAQAARAAVRAIMCGAETSVAEIVRRCHEELRKTRGVVMGIATLNTRDNTMTWLGIGNVEGVLLRPGPHALTEWRSLLLRRGVVGYILPELNASTVVLEPGDVLVFMTDGIRTDWVGSLPTGPRSARDIAEYICSHHTKGTDDALVLVARYRRTRS